MATRTFLAHVYISVTKTNVPVDGNGQPIIPAGSSHNLELFKNRQIDERTAISDIRAMSLAHTNKSAMVKDLQEVS